jgi:FkbM family methyltransferase
VQSKLSAFAGNLQKQIAISLSGGPLEGLIRRFHYSVTNHIPEIFLSESAIKGRSYDTMTLEIARQSLASGGSAIDIGAHEGSILRHLVKYSPGPHWAFEPIPAFAGRLRRRFPDVKVEQIALSDFNGEAQFNFLPGSAAYSSLLRRKEIEDGQLVRRLTVPVRTLDDYLPPVANVAFLKIDVEGAEASVIRGARQLLERCQPVTVFECFSSKLPDCIDALQGTGLRVSFLVDFLERVSRPEKDVCSIARERGEYYFAAHK